MTALAEFIRGNRGHIIEEWEVFAQSLVPAVGMNSLALRDHIEEMLNFIAHDIDSNQTGAEQIQKSQGGKARSSKHTAAETHAALRLAGGFEIDQMVSEYRALRASIIKLWSAQNTEPTRQDILDLTRFNESIDQEVAESVGHYTKKYNHLEDLFLGILSHDIRTPISAAHMCAELMPKIGSLNAKQTMLAEQIVDCTLRATEIVTNLFALMNARFGSGYPVVRCPMDMGFVARQLVEEMRTVYPTLEIRLEVSGETEGNWDKARIAQVFSNLIGNAVEHGFKGTPVDINVKGTATEVELAVHNQGVPIPATTMGKLFDSLTGSDEEHGKEQAGAVHMGLGLYITKEIVVSHGGKLSVVSSEKGGTTFVAHFPRAAPYSLGGKS